MECLKYIFPLAVIKEMGIKGMGIFNGTFSHDVSPMMGMGKNLQINGEIS